MYRIIWLAVLVAASTSVMAQSTRWTHELGYRQVRMYDKQSSPLIYHAHTTRLSSTYQKLNENALWRFSGGLVLGSNQSARHGKRIATLSDPVDLYGNQEHYEVEGNPSLSYFNPTLETGYYRSITVGKQPVLTGMELDGNFILTGMGLDTWYFANLSLGPGMISSVKLNNGHELPIQVRFPLINVVVREPYAKDPSVPLDNYFEEAVKSGSAVASIGQFQRIDWSVGYVMPFGENWKLGCRYSFGWMHYEKPRDFNAYYNELSVTLSRI